MLGVLGLRMHDPGSRAASEEGTLASAGGNSTLLPDVACMTCRSELGGQSAELLHAARLTLRTLEIAKLPRKHGTQQVSVLCDVAVRSPEVGGLT